MISPKSSLSARARPDSISSLTLLPRRLAAVVFWTALTVLTGLTVLTARAQPRPSINTIRCQHSGSIKIEQGELGGCLVQTVWPNAN